jgi:hypothetical protein
MEILAKTRDQAKVVRRSRGPIQAGIVQASRSISQDQAPAAGTARAFARALADAWPDFQAFEVDESSGTARGVIPSPGGYGRVASLGFTPETNLLRIDVELGRPTESRMRLLLEVPCHTRWTRVMCARDDRTAWYRAATVCTDLAAAGPVIRALVHDLEAALQSELLHLVIEPDGLDSPRPDGGVS